MARTDRETLYFMQESNYDIYHASSEGSLDIRALLVFQDSAMRAELLPRQRLRAYEDDREEHI